MGRGRETVFRRCREREFAFREQLRLEQIRDGIRLEVRELEVDTAQNHR